MGVFLMVNNIILNLLRADASVVVNKALAKKIGLQEAIVYAELISKFYYFSNKGQLTEEGFFFCTVEDLEDSTTLSKHQQSKVISKLVKLGLIEYKVKGIPPKRYFKIIEDLNILVDLLNNKEKALETIETDKKLKNLTIESEKNEPMKVKKVTTNNTNINNTNLISQSVGKVDENVNNDTNNKNDDALIKDRQADLEKEKEKICNDAEVGLYRGEHRELIENTIIKLLELKQVKVNNKNLNSKQIREYLSKLNINIIDFTFVKFRQAQQEQTIKNKARYFLVLLLSCIEEYSANSMY